MCDPFRFTPHAALVAESPPHLYQKSRSVPPATTLQALQLHGSFASRSLHRHRTVMGVPVLAAEPERHLATGLGSLRPSQDMSRRRPHCCVRQIPPA